jgi:hypothetical protein
VGRFESRTPRRMRYGATLYVRAAASTRSFPQLLRLQAGRAGRSWALCLRYSTLFVQKRRALLDLWTLSDAEPNSASTALSTGASRRATISTTPGPSGYLARMPGSREPETRSRSRGQSATRPALDSSRRDRTSSIKARFCNAHSQSWLRLAQRSAVLRQAVLGLRRNLGVDDPLK